MDKVTKEISRQFERIRKSIKKLNIKRKDRKHVSLEEFAAFLEISASTYAKRKNGYMGMTVASIQKLEKLLGISIIEVKDFSEEFIQKHKDLKL